MRLWFRWGGIALCLCGVMVLTGCSDFTKMKIDAQQLGVTVPSENRGSGLVDFRPEADKVFHDIRNGMGFYLGDNQLSPNRFSYLEAALVSQGAVVPSGSKVLVFDVVNVIDTSTPKNMGEFWSGVGDGLVKGIPMAIVGGAMGAGSYDLSTSVAGYSAYQNQVNAEKHTVIVYILLDVNHQKIEGTSSEEYNLFSAPDSDDVKKLTLKCIKKASLSVAKKLASK